MDDKTLYTRLLGLMAPWGVVRGELKAVRRRVARLGPGPGSEMAVSTEFWTAPLVPPNQDASVNRDAPVPPNHDALVNRDAPVPPNHGASVNRDAPVPPNHDALVNRDAPVPPNHGALVNRGAPVPPNHGASVNRDALIPPNHDALVNRDALIPPSHHALVNRDALIPPNHDASVNRGGPPARDELVSRRDHGSPNGKEEAFDEPECARFLDRFLLSVPHNVALGDTRAAGQQLVDSPSCSERQQPSASTGAEPNGQLAPPKRGYAARGFPNELTLALDPD